jgi:hypothetical protein
MNSKYDYDSIRDYLHGLTDAKTSLEMKELIKTDEIARDIAEGIIRLDKEFKEYDSAVDSYLEDFRQKQLKIIHQQKPARLLEKYWFRMAAALLLLITVGAVIRLMVSAPDYQTLVNRELAQPYPVSTILRSDGDGSAKEKGYQLYLNGDYKNASKYFEQISTEEKDLASIGFYNGLSYLYAEEYEKASKLFESDILVNSRYAQQAQWYQSLALIKSGNKKRAVEVLTIVVGNQQHFKRGAALELLEQLE